MGRVFQFDVDPNCSDSILGAEDNLSQDALDAKLPSASDTVPLENDDTIRVGSALEDEGVPTQPNTSFPAPGFGVTQISEKESVPVISLGCPMTEAEFEALPPIFIGRYPGTAEVPESGLPFISVYRPMTKEDFETLPAPVFVGFTKTSHLNNGVQKTPTSEAGQDSSAYAHSVSGEPAEDSPARAEDQETSSDHTHENAAEFLESFHPGKRAVRERSRPTRSVNSTPASGSASRAVTLSAREYLSLFR